MSSKGIAFNRVRRNKSDAFHIAAKITWRD